VLRSVIPLCALLSSWAPHRVPSTITINQLRARQLKWKWSDWQSLENYPSAHELTSLSITSLPGRRGKAEGPEAATSVMIQLDSHLARGEVPVRWPCRASVYGTCTSERELESTTALLDGMRSLFGPPFISVAVSAQWSDAMSEAA
jgi:hypothetical protein